MRIRSEDRIFLLKDENAYIRQSHAKFFDEDEYDHRGYHILHPQRKKENKMIIKVIER